MSESNSATKIAIVYYSATGTVHALAESIADGARKAGAEVRLRRVRELAPDEAIATNPAWAGHMEATGHIEEAVAEDLIWADGVIFGTPTRFGNVSSQLKQFLDTLSGPWMQNQLADKVYSGFTATSSEHGGHESTLLALYNTVHHFGGVTVAPGYTDPIKFADGNPYGTSHTAGRGDIPISDVTHQAASYQGGRVTRIAAALAAGLH